MHDWHQSLSAAGFVGLSFPREYGGHGLSLLHDAILNDELAASGAPAGPAINHISNAIRLFGSEEQKRGVSAGDARMHRPLVPGLQRARSWL